MAVGVLCLDRGGQYPSPHGRQNCARAVTHTGTQVALLHTCAGPSRCRHPGGGLARKFLPGEGSQGSAPPASGSLSSSSWALWSSRFPWQETPSPRFTQQHGVLSFVSWGRDEVLSAGHRRG